MCGLVGMINSRKKKFDYTAFCTLGIDNDSRGGDSVGIFIDGNFEYYCKGHNKSFFSDFMCTSNLLDSIEECTFAIAHCRKTSVGNTDLKSAQPVIIKNKETDKIDYVLMHNGTISNYKELAKKYISAIDIKDMTDSQVMAHIFYYNGYDVLEEYIGTASFIICDYRDENPIYLFWRAESKRYKYSQTITEERPLFLVKTEDDTLFISSKDDFFPAIARDCTIYKFPANCLCTYSKGEIYKIEEYNRNNALQEEYSYSNVNNYAYNPLYKGSTHTPQNNYSPNHSGANNSINVIGNTQTGKCYKGNVLLHGNYFINDFGDFSISDLGNSLWFWNGTLLLNQEAYMYLEKYRKELDCSISELDTWFRELVLYLSPYPYYKTGTNAYEPLKEVKSPIGAFNYDGKAYFPFTKRVFNYKNGLFQDSKECTIFESLLPWRLRKNEKLDLTVLSAF